jgi:hypothetical protein
MVMRSVISSSAAPTLSSPPSPGVGATFLGLCVVAGPVPASKQNAAPCEGEAPSGPRLPKGGGAGLERRTGGALARLYAGSGARPQGIKCGGRKTYRERDPELVKAAKELSAQRPRLSLREIAAGLEARGHTNGGKRYPAMSVRNMLFG